MGNNQSGTTNLAGDVHHNGGDATQPLDQSDSRDIGSKGGSVQSTTNESPRNSSDMTDQADYVGNGQDDESMDSDPE